ncbi:MAG: family 43 glycosylhydrolase [Clostridiales bacterium]|nr:family 43 glycosylhydrolase [Clostridiales bacterium]
MRLTVILPALLLASSPALCAGEPDSELSAYLMVYHKDQDHGLHMAVSPDGYTWSALNDDKPIIAGDSIAEQHGIRDPHIFRGPDGAFYLSMTDLHVFGKRDGVRDTEWERDGKKYGWGNNRGLVLMKSHDLINWTRTNIDFTKFPAQPDMDWSEVGCVWAPETVYDEEAGKLMIHFTTRQGVDKNIIYYAYVNDDYNALDSAPQLLAQAPDKAYNIIDSDIIKVGDTYHLFYVSHQKGATPKHATSKRITGPYVFDDNYHDGERQGHEAPNCWKRFDTDTYVVMYDNYRCSPMNFGFVETTDFVNYKPIGYFDAPDSPMRRTNFSEQKHGAVAPISMAELKRLESHWNTKPWQLRHGVPIDSIMLSDPAILADSLTQTYYMTGTGGKLWKSKDLALWDGPYTVAVTDSLPWAGSRPQIWAAEIHKYGDKYYYFATITNDSIVIDHNQNGDIPRRATHIFVSDRPDGPYLPASKDDYLPADRPTLDGTLWVEPDGTPYMVFCGEWLKDDNGTMEAVQLNPSLTGTMGEPFLLFKASASPWSREVRNEKPTPSRVTDGPWLFRTDKGRLGMIWTSWVGKDYTMGVAYSKSGTIRGPWLQEKKPITGPNLGHGMLFRTLDGQWLLSLHSHRSDNGRYIRRPVLIPVSLSGSKLTIK